MTDKLNHICFADLHILINTIQSSSVVNSSASASWLPICLPKFNQAAFVNAYVTFLRRKDSASPSMAQTPTQSHAHIPSAVASGSNESNEQQQSSTAIAQDTPTIESQISQTTSSVGEAGEDNNSTTTTNDTASRSDAATESSLNAKPATDISLICVSGMSDFDAVRSWCSIATEVRARFEQSNACSQFTTDRLTNCCRNSNERA